VAAAEEVARYVYAEILPLVNSALYACGRARPAEQSPCAFVAEYLLEHHSAYQPPPNMKLPYEHLIPDDKQEWDKPLGVSESEVMTTLQFFKKYDIDGNGSLEIEQLTLVILRMAEKIAGRPVPDTTVLRAIKTVMSEVALNNGDNTVTRQDLIGCLDRICPVFRSFRSPVGSGPSAAPQAKPIKKESTTVINELYDEFDLNEDSILMPDELFLLLRRACDHSGHDISDLECMELFRLLMDHAMVDKNDDELLDKQEVTDGFTLIFKFYNYKASQGWELENKGLAQAPPGKGPPGKGPPGKERADMVGPLMEAFTAVDQEQADCAPRIALAQQVAGLGPSTADLAEQLKALEMMIVDKDLYDTMVKTWVNAPAHKETFLERVEGDAEGALGAVEGTLGFT